MKPIIAAIAVICLIAFTCCVQQGGTTTTTSTQAVTTTTTMPTTTTSTTTTSTSTTTRPAWSCYQDSDCAPEQCCHPTSCVNNVNRPDCSAVLCTAVCTGPLDCGAGRCACASGRCQVKAAECRTDEDCARNDSRCADGIDPYHVCDSGSCVNLTFIADPCMMSHVCPKGSWDYYRDGKCFKAMECSRVGCNDRSNATTDACIYQGTDNEGCEYALKIRKECSSDSDCVPDPCCHPSECINQDYKTVCTDSCLAGCQGPLDCGAGRCACISGSCGIRTGYGY